jgi:glycine cleavage system H lipoate-binding protein
MKKKICHMIPEEEKQCVWMTSGLISYKLCTRDYRCEECIFDQVIRNEAAVDAVAGHGDGLSAASLSTADSLQEYAALFYHSGHCWAKVEDADQVRIGIDGILAQLVSPVKTVVLPRAGDSVVQGQCFAHIIQEKHIVELVSPLTGTVQSVNQGLKAQPQTVAEEPWGRGWLVTIRPDNLEHDLKSLMFGRKAMEWYQKKEHEVAMKRTDMLSRHAPELGPTLQDGGTLLVSLADMLSSEQYEQIIDLLFRPDDAA